MFAGSQTHLLLLWGVSDLLDSRDGPVLFAGIGKALQVLHIDLIGTQPCPARTFQQVIDSLGLPGMAIQALFLDTMLQLDGENVNSEMASGLRLVQ